MLRSQKNKITDTTESTNTLKGIAILIVVINHYFNMNISGDYTQFANLIISIFFLLSGYGISHSLNNRFQAGFSLKGLVLFYYARLVRIFPLFWLALIIQSLITDKWYSIWTFLCFTTEGHYWFVIKICHCYIISPFLFWILRKNKILRVVVVVTILSGINILFRLAIFRLSISPGLITIISALSIFVYRGEFILHILIFFIGMCFHIFISSKSNNTHVILLSSKYRKIIFWSALILILCFMVIAKYSDMPRILFRIFPIIPLILLCFYAVLTRVFSSFFSFMGQISYSIYLFHFSFFHLLKSFGLLPKDSLSALAWTLLLFPAFIFVCRQMETLGNVISRRMQKKTLAT